MTKISDLQKEGMTFIPKSDAVDVVSTTVRYRSKINENCPADINAEGIIDFMDRSARMPLNDYHFNGMEFSMQENELISVLSYINDMYSAAKGKRDYPEGCGTTYQAEKDGIIYKLYLYFKSNGTLGISGMEARFTRENSDGTIDRFFPETNSWERSEGLEKIKEFGASSDSAEKYSRMLETAAGRTFPFLEEEKMLKMCIEAEPVLKLADQIGDNSGLKILAYVDQKRAMDGNKSHAALTLPDYDKFGTVVYFKNGKYWICQEHLPKQDSGNMLILNHDEKWFRVVAKTGDIEIVADLLRSIFKESREMYVCAVLPLSEHAYVKCLPALNGLDMEAEIVTGNKLTDTENKNIEKAKAICSYGIL